MIHGKTKIELYNPNTKVKTVYRDENVFQSAVIAKYMRSLGYSGFRPADYSYSNLLGGILLFRDAITEGSQYMPASNQMVGNGSYGVTNSGNPTEMGSFNESESSESLSAITQVYDFTTSQANGTISCVSLTSKTGGYIGYGNPSRTSHETIKDFFANASIEHNLGGTHAFYNGKTYVLTSFTNQILTVTKKHFPVLTASIRNMMTETVEIDMTNYHMNSGIGARWQDGNAIYFTYFQNVAAGGTMYYYKYNLDTDTVEEKTLINSGTKNFNTNGINGGGHGTICINTEGGGAYLFDMTTQVILKELDFTPTTTTPLWYGLIGMHRNGILWIYDRNTDRLFPTNGARSPQWGAAYLSYDASCDVIRDVEYQDAVSIGNNPLYLATINNLENPVSKTAAQSMKVTYTLTEAE